MRVSIIFLLVGGLLFAQEDPLQTVSRSDDSAIKKQSFLQLAHPRYDKFFFRLGLISNFHIGHIDSIDIGSDLISFGTGYKRFYIEAGVGVISYKTAADGSGCAISEQKQPHEIYSFMASYRVFLDKYFSLYPYIKGSIIPGPKEEMRNEYGFMLMLANGNTKIKWMPAVKVFYNHPSFLSDDSDYPRGKKGFFSLGIDLLSVGF